MSAVTFIVPGSIEARTGGTIYDRRLAEGLRDRGWDVTVIELDGSFPFPTPSALADAGKACGHLAEGTAALVDGLAFGAMPEIAERHRDRLQFVPIVHLPLAADVGLDAATAQALRLSERRALATAARVVVTGRATLRLLEGYGVPPEHIVTIEPGTDPSSGRPEGRSLQPAVHGGAGLQAGPRADPPVRLLCVATLNPGKGHALLLRALAGVPGHNWTLVCAGSLTRHPETASRVRSLIDQLRLGDRVTLAGDLDRDALESCYAAADVFVLATLRETYGMAVSEALAHGIPVISTRTGAIPELVGDAAGMVVEPGNLAAMTEALAHMLADETLRAQLTIGARAARRRLPTWEDQVSRMEGVLRMLTP